MPYRYVICPKCQTQIPVHRLGRKPLNIPVKNICDTIREYRDVTRAAEKLGCSRGYIYKVLKENALTPKGVKYGVS
ncbi:hypothetical protein ACFLXA_01685 [Chloroflexota bacterium]